MAAFQPPGDCPVCGEFVAAGRKSCAHCGADERSGWSEETDSGALGLPDGDFDYDDFVKEQFGTGGRRTKPPLFWWIIGIVLVAVLIWVFVVGWH